MDNNKILKADFLDILFEGKNKDYGAYELRKSYDKRLQKATILTILTCLVLILGYSVESYLAKQALLHPKPIMADTKLQNIKVDPNQPPPPPPPPPPPEPPKVKPQIQFTPPRVVKDNQVKPEEQPPDINKIKDQAISTVTVKGDPNGIDPGLVPDKGGVVAAAPVDKVFTFVEQEPKFPGGDAALFKYLHDHIRYPAVAQEEGIQGTVIVQFVVGMDGKIRDVTTVGAIKGAGLEQEAIRVVKTMPAWRPGKQNGRAVSVQYNLPVHFELN
ncbi:MAG: energy transducer TonB [Chitinophagaceae bacterium]